MNRAVAKRLVENPRVYLPRIKRFPMLPSSFFDWWFAPWTYAVNSELKLPLAQDRFAQRDGYRLWCKRADVEPDFPRHFHAAWNIVATSDGAQLLATARLFAGLIAAREHDQILLALLPSADRKWCLSIAATQPLQRCPSTQYDPDDSAELRGLVELGRRLESGFPGLWSRLRLLLPGPLYGQIDALLEQAVIAPREADAALARAHRCWRACRSRVESSGASGLLANEAAPDRASNEARVDIVEMMPA